jgi:hypothetical protein
MRRVGSLFTLVPMLLAQSLVVPRASKRRSASMTRRREASADAAVEGPPEAPVFLYLAASEGRAEVVEDMIATGYDDVDGVYGSERRTPLWIAANNGPVTR